MAPRVFSSMKHHSLHVISLRKYSSPPRIYFFRRGNDLFVHSVMHVPIGNLPCRPMKSSYCPNHLAFSKLPSTLLPRHFPLSRQISRSSANIVAGHSNRVQYLQFRLFRPSDSLMRNNTVSSRLYENRDFPWIERVEKTRSDNLWSLNHSKLVGPIRRWSKINPSN